MRRSLTALALFGRVAYEQTSQPLARESPSRLLSSSVGDLMPGRFIATVEEAAGDG
jgi:hypothetical protein